MANRVIHVLDDLVYLMLNLEKEHLTLSFIFSLLNSNPVVWASQFDSPLFTHCTLVLIQALSLSACNNVKLFITEMEQDKHLEVLCYIGKS